MKQINTIDGLSAAGRLTQYLKKAIIKATELAKKRGGDFIELQDIFVAILEDRKNIGTRVLEKMGVDIDMTLDTLDRNYISNYGRETSPIPSEEFRQALSDAFLIASDLSHVYVGTEHILLAILQFEEEPFVIDLKKVGIDIESVKSTVLSFGTYQPGIFSQLSEDDDQEPEKRSSLGLFARDMNSLAKDGKFMKVWGREDEINRLIHILSRKTKNNPILVGESGVGKTAVVQGLVHKIENGNVPVSFKNMNIIQLDLAAIIAGSKIRGDVEERILAIVNEVSEDPSKILFIDEIHMIVGAGSGGQGSMDVANILKPHLTTGDLRVIGATTYDEYQKYFEEDDALARRFQPVNVNEISRDDAYQVLLSLKDEFEDYHSVKIEGEALLETVNLSDRYITNRYFPDKAIDIIDEAAAAKRIDVEGDAEGIKDNKEKISRLENEKTALVNSGDMEEAVIKLKEIRKLKKKVEKLEAGIKKSKKKSLKVGIDDIRKVVSDWTKIPVNTLTSKDLKSIQKIGPKILGRVIGQEKAVESVVSALKRSKVGIVDDRRPMSSFMFLGPSGVGKTELAKVIAEEVFGSSETLIQIDMSEFMEQHSVSKLIGSPPGYIGYQEGGQLTEKVRRNPYSVVLFDEIEKAHPELLNILLQVMEEGILKDSKGRVVNFRNTIIILTSNIGAAEIKNNSTLGFTVDRSSKKKDEEVDEAYEEMKVNLMEELKDTLPPEFLNRLDDIVIFRSLEQKDMKEITKLQLKDLNARLEEKKIEIEYTNSAVEYIAEEGFSEEYGARNIRRKIQELVENNLAEELLEKGIVMGRKNIKVKISKDKEKLTFIIKK